MLPRKLFLLAFVFSSLASFVQAAPVALVGNEQGHAILVEFRGNCYAVMPNHVASQDRMTLISPLPQTSGVALVFYRAPELDLALAFVEGDIADRCDQQWSKLGRDLSPLFTRTFSGGLSRVQFNGQFIDRAEATIIDADDTNFVIATSDRWASSEIMSGVSGALFYIEDVPAGIALTSLDTSRARFLRMDRVFDALDPILNGTGAVHPASQPFPVANQGLGYRVTDQVRVKDGIKLGLNDTYAADWDGSPIELVFTLSNTLPVPLKRISLQTSPDDTGVTFPQKIQIALDSGGPGSPYWRNFDAPDMTPFGNLEVNTGGTKARRVRLRIQSVWHPDRPMRIDRVVFE